MTEFSETTDTGAEPRNPSSLLAARVARRMAEVTELSETTDTAVELQTPSSLLAARVARRMAEQGAEEATAKHVPAPIIHIETLRQHRQLVQLQEWLEAQLPWQRAMSQKVSERIRAA